jgi:hypothetical protein
MFKQIRFQRTSGKVALVLIAALVAGLCFEATALAGGKGGSSGKSHAAKGQGSFAKGSTTKASFAKSGKLAKGGHHQHHRNHHWSSSRYFAQYGCTFYYDTDDQCWYYWCQRDDCYYPTSYCPYGTYSW